MPQAPKVIHQYGKATKAKLDNGLIVEKKEELYIPSYRRVFPCLDHYSHFIYYDGTHIGSTLMCTCGSFAGVVGYRAYEKYNSFIGHEVVACLFYVEHGHHADGAI